MPKALYIRTVYSDDHVYDHSELNSKYDEGHRAVYYANVNDYQYNNYYHHRSKLQFSMVGLVAAHLWPSALPRGICRLLLLQEGGRGQEVKEISYA